MSTKPIIFLAFANDPAHPLPALADEARAIQDALKPAQEKGLCEIIPEPYATLDRVLAAFREHPDRVAIFHFAGHAGGDTLLLEAAGGQTTAANAGGLARFLAEQAGLALVFLNGCATREQAQGLLDAGVSVVIATSQKIKDTVAASFAAQFYTSLAKGVTLRRAFGEAEGAIQAATSGQSRELFEEAMIASAAGELPWALYKRPGAEDALSWNLPAAAGDPLFDLPLPPIDLPESPYRRLNWFGREHAPVFFGRGQLIRDLYQGIADPGAPPIVLFYGQSGVGKSSLLAAGLLPRLEASYRVVYQRRDHELGLLGSLATAIASSGTASLAVDRRDDLRAAWQAQEDASDKPLVILLDQIEEVFTRPNKDLPDELPDFLAALHDLFGDPARRPNGKLVLSFRKEWLAEIEKRCTDKRLPRGRAFLERLDRQGIIEAVEGPARVERLRRHFGLVVAPELPSVIADDLLADAGSSLAPTLQVLLTKMWDRATELNRDHPTFDVLLYQKLKAEGLLLRDFLLQQIAELKKGLPTTVESGLALDLLAFHTTPLGTAEERSLAILRDTYEHQKGMAETLVAFLKNLYVLVDPVQNLPDGPPASRLAHDTLAPLVRLQFDESISPGQRARRVLEARRIDWQGGKEGALLDAADLITVERGASGMRAWDPDETRLVERSRRQQTDNLAWQVAHDASTWDRAGRNAERLWPNDLSLFRASNRLRSGRHPFNDLESAFLRASEDRSHTDPPPLTPDHNPYAGLRAFSEKDSPLFFGRQAVIEELVAKVTVQPLTLVVGPAGCGKTSLISAGLIPELRRGPNAAAGRETDADWQVIVLRQHEAPLTDLASALTEAGIMTVGSSVFEGASADPKALAAQIDAWCARQPAGKLLLVVDQFESLLQSAQAEVSARFLALLAGALDACRERFRVVLALRSEAERRLEGTPLATHAQPTRFWLRDMSVTEVREAIEGPAWRAALQFEPELVDRIAFDAIALSQGLPLFSFTMSRLYDTLVARQDAARTMTVADYESIGGVSGCLGLSANSLWEQSPAEDRDVLRDIMLRLVSGIDPNLARAGVPMSELRYDDERRNERLNRLLGHLVDNRLITLSREANSQDTTVRLGHDSLLRSWQRLQTWYDEEGTREFLRLRQMLTQQASAWEQESDRRKKAGLLWANDPRLPQVQALLGANTGAQGGLRGRLASLRQTLWPSTAMSRGGYWLNPEEKQFIGASIKQRGAGLRRIVGITAVVIISLAGLTILANYQATLARAQSDIANAESARAVAAEATAVAAGNARATEVVVRAAAEAEAEQQRTEAERQSRRAKANELATNVTLQLNQPVFDPSLVLLLASESVSRTLSADGDVTPYASRVLDSALTAVRRLGWRMTLPRHGHLAAMKSAAFSPDGMTIVTAGADNIAHVWDATTGQELRQLQGHTAGVNSAAFSPDGRIIVTTSEDATVRLWDVATGHEFRQLPGFPLAVTPVAFSPDGKIIVTGGCDKIEAGLCTDGSAHLWDAATGQELRQLLGHRGAIISLAFSLDGKTIITASAADGTARLWDAATGQELRQLQLDPIAVTSAALSPDGKIIITGGCEKSDGVGRCTDGSARLWDAATGEELRQLQGQTGAVTAVAFSPDGQTVVTAGEDSTARLWDAASGQELRQLLGHAGAVDSVAFSPDGQSIITAGSDGTARLWDTAIHLELRQLKGHTAEVDSAAFSPDGMRIVTASADRTARMWDAQTGRELGQLTGHTRPVRSAAYSPDGESIVTAGGDNTRLWDARTGQELRQLTGHADSAVSAAYSPDGKYIVTASSDTTARLWDAGTGQEVRTLSGHTDTVYAAAFSPDGSTIITASADRTARLWDAATGQEVRTLSGHTDTVDAAAFSPDGSTIVTAGADRTARLWDAATGQELRRLQGHAGEVTAAAFSPDGKTIVTASWDGTARLWEAATGQELRQLQGHTDLVTSAAFSPDGKTVLTASRDGTARLWLMASVEDLLAQASALIQRDPPTLTPEERQQYGLD